MSWRTVVISNRCKLDYQMGYMVIRSEEILKVYLDEIAILIIENPAVSLTGCLLEALINKKVKVIFCDSRHNPNSELLPYYGNYQNSKKIRDQCGWNPETCDAVWQEIVRKKINQQKRFLIQLGRERESNLLGLYEEQIRPGDETNREGLAAKVYFNAVFGMDFSRREESEINAALNYGYSIILSAFNREIVSSGYITQIGIFHDNTFNCFNLSSDLMEPFRILIDRCVYKMMPVGDLSQEQKYKILNTLNDEVIINGDRQTVLNAIGVYSRSVFRAIEQNNSGLIYFYELPDNESNSIL